MMKLYISYYGNYVSIVEGIYNEKKDKYNIKNVSLITEDDVKIDSSDKYSLLKEALKLNNSKTKKVVFSLNTRDVIIKSNSIPKVNPKDLDGIMNNEMYEMMSLDYDQYTFSYEVLNERTVDDKETLDVVIGAVLNDELDIILDIFKEFKLSVECIDTMTTAYARLIKKIEYDDIMMLNVGRYGSYVNIYKEDSLFIYDNIPVRINSISNYSVALALVDEVKGLVNFYSSRNFGKTIDTIVLLGESNNNSYIQESFKESFNSNIVTGIENLFDIEQDLQGDIQTQEISKVCETLGSMSVTNDKKGYSHMNLLPIGLRNRQRKSDVLKKSAIIAPVTIGVLLSPYLIFGAIEMKVESDTLLAQSRLDEIILQYKDIEEIDDNITKAREEIAIYDMLSSKSVNWSEVLSAIDRNIPYRVDLTNINVSYDSTLINPEEEQDQIQEEQQDTTQENNEEQNTEGTETTEETTEIPIYEQIPNVILLDGIATSPEKVGQFIYSLNQLSYFKSVELKSSIEDEASGGYVFYMVLTLEEGVVSSE